MFEFMDKAKAEELAAHLSAGEELGWTYRAVQVSAKYWKVYVYDEDGFPMNADTASTMNAR